MYLYRLNTKAVDTVSLCHVSSCEVTRSWDVRGDLTLNSMAKIYTSVTLLTSRDLAWSSSRLTCQHASLKFLLSDTFRETWRTCRALFRRYQLFPVTEEMLIEKVRQRTFLYHSKSPDFRDQHMRANAWEGIGKELKIKRKFYVSSRDVRIVCPRLKITNGLTYRHCVWKVTQYMQT
jgi:hypothetical protein